jgi:hypothetical protein
MSAEVFHKVDGWEWKGLEEPGAGSWRGWGTAVCASSVQRGHGKGRVEPGGEG